MFFEANKSILYSDTLMPDIFISEYLPSMEGDCVKLYTFCLFMCKNNRQASNEELSKKLGISIDKVKEYMLYLESIGIITRKTDGIIMNDLKEKEINKIYRLKTTSTPEEAALSSERNKKRNSIITAINNTFFQGMMSPSWYTDIDTWFNRYKFDEDVMMNLFQHCYDHKGLAKNYIIKVAESWLNKNIKSYFDLENYFVEYQRFKDIKIKIVKKLKLSRNLTEYEEEYIEKWVLEYQYGFDIIELALKKTTAKASPNFNYIHAILQDWFKNNLKSKEDIIIYETNRKKSTAKKPVEAAIPQHNNFDQRQYDDEYYNSFFTNIVK